MKIVKDTLEYGLCLPFGCTVVGDSVYFSTAKSCASLSLNLYRNDKVYGNFLFSEEDKIGDVWRLSLKGIDDLDKNIYSYTYTADGKEYSDIYATDLCGRDRWGDKKHPGKVLKALIDTENIAWKNSDYKNIKYSDSVIYRLHVRGFTISPKSGVAKDRRGTFYGVIDKLPYLKDMGITTIELMPPYEYNEIVDSKKVNYWGFTKDAFLMSPKKAFGGEKGFLDMVGAIHKEGMELIADMYFSGSESTEFVLNTLRTWRIKYFCDGIHIIGNAPVQSILKDPYLKGMKLFADDIPQGSQSMEEGLRKPIENPRRCAAVYNDSFMNDMRAFIKGDADMVGRVIEIFRDNPSKYARINYIANVNGFSLIDAFSYDRKHNEENGENNLDGTDFNYSWNCGIEGETRKKNITELRKKLYKNAMLATLLSAGTPLINSGDEMGHTKKGNNNSWCQDNYTEWINWADLDKNKELFEFTKNIIELRKKYPVFRLEKRAHGSDYKVLGFPDISFHGEDVWKVDHENYRRQFAVLYNNEYYQSKDELKEDYSYFYICFNMHWEKHEFSLPKLPEDKKWSCLISTDKDIEEKNKELSDHKERILVDERSIIILAGK
ncbi:MAG: alpha-amylase family glycosyl hydrolase [Eubacteriales bacterium]|nr:alpha-amylase family glycosyl hydrolase [Eubacteriales bacterium]